MMLTSGMTPRKSISEDSILLDYRGITEKLCSGGLCKSLAVSDVPDLTTQIDCSNYRKQDGSNYSIHHTFAFCDCCYAGYYQKAQHNESAKFLPSHAFNPTRSTARAYSSPLIHLRPAVSACFSCFCSHRFVSVVQQSGPCEVCITGELCRDGQEKLRTRHWRHYTRELAAARRRQQCWVMCIVPSWLQIPRRAQANRAPAMLLIPMDPIVSSNERISELRMLFSLFFMVITSLSDFE